MHTWINAIVHMDYVTILVTPHNVQQQRNLQGQKKFTQKSERRESERKEKIVRERKRNGDEQTQKEE